MKWNSELAATKSESRSYINDRSQHVRSHFEAIGEYASSKMYFSRKDMIWIDTTFLVNSKKLWAHC